MDKKRALIVDDDLAIREMLSTLLQRENIHCFVASSAEEALSVLKKCSPTEVQVLLTDLSLPGMDGASLCRKIRRSWPLMVTIALTGHADLFTICECREVGFDDYLNKPVSVGVLRASMVSAFKRARYWNAIAQGSYIRRSKKRPNGSGIL